MTRAIFSGMFKLGSKRETIFVSPSPAGDLFGDVDEDEPDLFSLTESAMKASESAGGLFRDSAATTPLEPKKGMFQLKVFLLKEVPTQLSETFLDRRLTLAH